MTITNFPKLLSEFLKGTSELWNFWLSLDGHKKPSNKRKTKNKTTIKFLIESFVNSPDYDFKLIQPWQVVKLSFVLIQDWLNWIQPRQVVKLSSLIVQ